MIINTNIQIVIVISIAFFVVFLSLFILEDIFPTPNSNIEKSEFFVQKFDPNIKKIFIFGSSQTGTLNTAHIIQKVAQSHNDYTVYNLSYDNDNPKKRLVSLQEAINLKPKIVLYGVTFRDFIPEIKKENIFSITQIKNNFESYISINPKLITVKAIKNLLGDTTIDLKNDRKINQPNTPFTELSERATIIVNENELKKQIAKHETVLVDFSEDNKQITNLKKIIYELKKNDIKVILFTVPLPRIYLDSVPDSEKEELHVVLSSIAKDFDIEFHDFTEKYEDLSIWLDVSHVAVNPQTIIYSDDVAKIILQAIQ